MGKKISQISSTESTALSDTDVFEGEESGGTSFQYAYTVLKSSLKTYFDQTTDVSKNAGLLNGKLSVSLSTTDLVVAVKTLAGADPSASDIVRVRIGDTEYTLTAALSVTIPDGGNTFNTGSSELATHPVDYFTYLRYNATDGLCIGVGRISHALLYSDFSTNGTDETMTDESGAVWNDVTTAGASDACAVVGRFTATHAAGVGYEWSSPTSVVSRPVYDSNILTWTPTWTNITVGSGTELHWYQRVGRHIRGAVSFILAADSSVGAGVILTMPFGRSASYSGTVAMPSWPCRLLDATAQPAFTGMAIMTTTGTVAVQANSVSGSYIKTAALSSAIPFTWTTSDQLEFSFDYLAD